MALHRGWHPDLPMIEQMAYQGPYASAPFDLNPQTRLQRKLANDGFLILRGAVDASAIRAYEREWMASNGGPNASLGVLETYERPFGWTSLDAVHRMSGAQAIWKSPAIQATISDLFEGEPIVPTIALTNWRSPALPWHLEQYLNRDPFDGHIIHIWIALAPISEESRPFQYVPESHRWIPILDPSQVASASPEASPFLLLQSSDLMGRIIEETIKRQHGEIRSFTADAGDVLMWHTRLFHRTAPGPRSEERRAIIIHAKHQRLQPSVRPASSLPLLEGFYERLPDRN